MSSSLLVDCPAQANANATEPLPARPAAYHTTSGQRRAPAETGRTGGDVEQHTAVPGTHPTGTGSPCRIRGFGSRIVLVGVQRQHTNHLSFGFVPDGEAVVMIDEAAAVETVSPGVVLQRGVPDRGPEAGHTVPDSRSARCVGSRHLTLLDG